MDYKWTSSGPLKEKKIFLLQARPVTTFDKETDFEIMHGPDTPLRSEKEYNTIANVGEVLPGATSPLGISSMFRLNMEAMTLRTYGRRMANLIPWNPYFVRGFGHSAGHALFNVLDGVLRFYNGKGGIQSDAHMIGIFGRILEDEELLRRAAYRNTFYPMVSPRMMLYYMLHELLTASSHLEARTKKFRGMTIDLSGLSTSQEMYYKLMRYWLDFFEAFKTHYECSSLSSMANLKLYTMLLTACEDNNLENVYNDVAYILSSCQDVESVGVPHDIENIASVITKDYGKDFQDLEPREALMWLERSDSEAGLGFRNLLAKHGHRCVREFDVYSKPWGNDPIPLVQVIQNSMSSVGSKRSKKVLSTEETIANLKTALTWKNKFLLKFFIPLSRKAVGLREKSKSLWISVVNTMRAGYRQLAEMMVIEGRLPSADLMYFLEHHELIQLLKTRSPKLIQKAARRKKLFPEMQKMIFPETSEGIPIPVNYNAISELSEGSLCMKGVPVSQGVATARARVATSVKDAADIKAGEILIAHSTDIGWSPYFPLLAGVVTELGGLISHGAVVAREYGLPCVVSVVGATQKFKTGDVVRIDGGKGTIQRIDD